MQTVLIPSNNVQPSGYKAEIRLISPSSERDLISRHNKCFVGVSLENQNFTGGKLQSIVDFVSNRYTDCCFLLGDHVHRLTLQINQGITEVESLEHATNLGNNFINSHRDLLKNTYTGEPFRLIRGSDICHSNEVMIYLSALEYTFEKNYDFRLAVEHFARQFIMRQQLVRPNGVKLSSQYVLEELAETCYMISVGYQVLVYPGSLAIFQQISEKVFRGLPVELDNLINVSLRIKRRGKKSESQGQALLSVSNEELLY